jgi:hypothetical protein
MDYIVRMRGVIVGRSALDRSDAATHSATGEFRPGVGYDLVQPIFRLWSQAMPRDPDGARDSARLARFEAARARLGLELFDARGESYVVRSIHIADFTEEDGPDALELTVVSDDPRFWNDRRSPD